MFRLFAISRTRNKLLLGPQTKKFYSQKPNRFISGMKSFRTLPYYYQIPISVILCYTVYKQCDNIYDKYQKRKKRSLDKIMYDEEGEVRTLEDEVKLAYRWQVSLYKLIPLRAISRFWGYINNVNLPFWLRDPILQTYIWFYKIDLSEATQDKLSDYKNLNQLFCRKLKPGVRPLDLTSDLISPVDGKILHCGLVRHDDFMEQVKGVKYSLSQFLGPGCERILDLYLKSKNGTTLPIRNFSTPNFNTTSSLSSNQTGKTDNKSFMPKQESLSLYNALTLPNSYVNPLLYAKYSSTSSRYPTPKENDKMTLEKNNDATTLLYHDGAEEHDSGIIMKMSGDDDDTNYDHSSLRRGSNSNDDPSSNVTSRDRSPSPFTDKSQSSQENLTQLKFDSNNNKINDITQYDMAHPQITDYLERMALDTMEPEDVYTILSDERRKHTRFMSADSLRSPKTKDLLCLSPANELYYCIIYLAPGDYHGFHSPVDWVVVHRRHFPGELFSVCPSIVRWIQGLFNFNERVVFTGTWRYGFFSMAAVGATNVGSIKIDIDKDLKTNLKKWKPGTFFDKIFRDTSSVIINDDNPSNDSNAEMNGKKPKSTVDNYTPIVVENFDIDTSTHVTTPKNAENFSDGILIQRGDYFGEFNLGSTIVCIFEAPSNFKFNVAFNEKVRLGQSLGHFLDAIE